jgi:hypothetical protein
MTYNGVIIGLTGKKRAGKSTVVEILRQHGFQVRSTRDAVMRYISQDSARGDPHDTKNQQYWGNQARRINCGDVWMPILLEQPIEGDTIFDSARYPDQHYLLKEHFGTRYMLLAIDASFERRCAWELTSKRSGSATTRDEFIEIDQRDWNGYLRGEGQDVEGCFAEANYRIQNDYSLQDLERNVLQAVAVLRAAQNS